MKRYFKRLKTHPGWSFAFITTCFGAIAGAQNKSAGDHYLIAAGIGAGCVAVVTVSVILISNFKRAD